MSLTNIVFAILISTLIAVIGIPAYNRYIVQSSISPVAEEMQRYMGGVKIHAQTEGVTPYEGLTQKSFARDIKDGALKANTSTGVVLHGLGGGNNGTVTVSETGDTASWTFADMSSYACPGFPSTMQKAAQTIKINGKTVKDVDASNNSTTDYTSAKAGDACTDGDTNEIVLTIR
ncbi:type 4 pilus major pilin [Pseudomonas sp. Pseusp122]|uniref:type 4 pilus major pilin n=1 Tax=unclassified Pseudomonas TaxID=196821 RepID=UPI0039A704F7